MSEKLSNSAENSELNQSTPSEILDFEARLVKQQEDLAQAQSAVEELNFKSDAMDRVKAQTDLREAKAAYDESMASLNDEWVAHGGERLENARLAVEGLDFNSDAMDRVKAQTELRDAENAWVESYNSAEDSPEQPEGDDGGDDKIDEIASDGIDKVNQIADEHMQAIEDHAEKASEEIREEAYATEAPEAEAHNQEETDDIESAFDLDVELEKSKQKLHNRADELEAAAQKRFVENNEVADDVEPNQDDMADEILAAKQALDYQERPDETTAEQNTEEFEDYEIPTSSEFTDDEPEVRAESEPEDSELIDDDSTVETSSEDGEFVDDEPEADGEKDTSEAEPEVDGGEFVDDDEEESEEDKKRFGKMRSFISDMRKKAGVTYLKAKNSIMDGFSSIGDKVTARKDGELDEDYEKRKKAWGIATVAIGALALSAASKAVNADHFGNFNVPFGAGTDGDNGSGAEGIPTADLGHIDAEPAPDVDTGGTDNSDFDHDNNTPEVDSGDWNESATTVDNGEGWYQTFEDMNIPKDEWNDLLQKVGPKLESQGYAYTMRDGSYGINRPGQLPIEVLDMIEQNR